MRTNWLRYLIASALLLNLLVIRIHYYLLHRFAKSQPFPLGAVIAPIAGVSFSGDVVPESAPDAHPCHVIRYTSIHCRWCLQDEPAWRDFGDALRTRGCDSVLLAPSAADLPEFAQSPDGQKSITAVSADTWSKAGTLSPGDKKDALANLRE